jgi:spermidine synthase
LPEISCKLDDPRVKIIADDGIKYIKENKNEFDVIIIDSTDPIGPAKGLFKREFYASVYDCLKQDGLFVAQSESPFFNGKLIKSIYEDVSSLFPITKLYTAFVPTYPGGLWSFTMGSKKYDPLTIDLKSIDFKTRYLTKELYKSCFVLPKFTEEILV